ncbi:eukaryotic translation initiation factor 3 subunit A [Knufia obscura]|uniref:Eukaryotic translation initiation factor 3 subunit A n=2 Tax=Knufia TaxID=430999 RepID=A0AAN8EVS5_9EURO|nr:eukaryotic translation initiation factor 3 subunit A [Knufia obscura]KAK5953293.1 eukaryotic translation initiation factor 3 subunit A [Knufia fluminis]
MPPPPHIKPENVLKRAQELIAVEQPQAALNVLHEHVTSKRSRSSPIASLEPVLLQFVELCVDLKKGKSAKDGLYQYKNIAQNTNVGTIELVLKRFIELAEKKVTEAQEKAEQVQTNLDTAAVQSATNIEDLDALETPETLLLATVSGEQSKDRTDRAIVTPWLKFLWETYRTVLEILKNNSRLEIMYQSTAHQAFDFCLRYTRKTEFRRLCELLRNHVQNAHKYSSQMHAINLNEPETLQRHLETRFRQLNVADELELWQEAFRSVEDIHMLMTLSKRPAKNIMMANYYEKLTKIFLVSDNFLFHAAAYNRYYNLLRQSQVQAAGQTGQAVKRDNPQVSEEALSKYASFVVLSALAIPVISTSRSRGALVDMDENRKNKNTRLTNLLSMPAAPTRAGLFKDILGKGLLNRVRPEIRDLYNILEVDFHPLSICKKISPILAKIGQDSEMERYVVPLQQVILTRLFQQLSQVYESVDLKFVNNLAQFPEPFQVTPAMIEKFIMNGCKKGDLAIRLDHVSGILTFDNDVFSNKTISAGSSTGSAAEAESVQRLQNTPAEIARSQLSRLAKTLHITCMYVDPSYTQARLAAREAALARAEAGSEAEREALLARRSIIEKRKEAASDAIAKKQREEEAARRTRQQQQVEAEARRLRDETRQRELKRVLDEQQRIKRIEVEKQLNELKGGMKIDLEGIEIDDLDTNAIRMLKLTQLEKDKEKKDRVIATTAKRIDHLERAFRREELKHLDEDYERQREEDKKEYETRKQITLEDAQTKYKESIALKRRLGRLVDNYDSFKSSISQRRHKEFEKLRQKADREFEAAKQKRVAEFKAHREAEKRAKEEAERQAREEEERIEREAADKAAAEEERKRKLEERKQEAERRRAEADAVVAKQMQREAEAEARRLARKQEGAGPSGARGSPFDRVRDPAPAMDERTPSSEPRGPPRIAGLKGGTWREREAAKKEAEAAAAGGAVSAPAAAGASVRAESPAAVPTPAAAPAQAPARSGYVPPHLRNRGAAPEAALPDRTASPADRTASPANGASAPRTGTAGGWRGSAPSMREGRQDSRDGSDAPAPAPKPRTGGGYVPPHLRNKQ